MPLTPPSVEMPVSGAREPTNKRGLHIYPRTCYNSVRGDTVSGSKRQFTEKGWQVLGPKGADIQTYHNIRLYQKDGKVNIRVSKMLDQWSVFGYVNNRRWSAPGLFDKVQDAINRAEKRARGVKA